MSKLKSSAVIETSAAGDSITGPSSTVVVGVVGAPLSASSTDRGTDLFGILILSSPSWAADATRRQHRRRTYDGGRR